MRAARGALGEAEGLLRRALTIERASLGDDHPLLAETLVAMAVVLDGLARYDEALRAAEQALTIEDKRLPPGHPVIAETLETQARALRALGDSERAAAAEARARAIRERQPAR